VKAIGGRGSRVEHCTRDKSRDGRGKVKKGEGQRQRRIVSSGRASERVPPGFIGMKNKVRSQSVGALVSSRLSSLPSSLALMTIRWPCYGDKQSDCTTDPRLLPSPPPLRTQAWVD
jgi:hypothetical protein